jgi:hypothetical protein
MRLLHSSFEPRVYLAPVRCEVDRLDEKRLGAVSKTMAQRGQPSGLDEAVLASDLARLRKDAAELVASAYSGIVSI